WAAGPAAGAAAGAAGGRHDDRSGLRERPAGGGFWKLALLEGGVGPRLRLRVRARDVILAKSRPADVSALNVFPGTVSEIGTPAGPIVELRINCHGEALLARLTRYSVDRLGLAPGASVFVLVKSVALDRRSLSGPIKRTPLADAETNDE